MRESLPIQPSRVAAIALALVISWLSACAGAPQKKDDADRGSASTVTATRTTDDNTSLPPSAFAAEFAAAVYALSRFDWMSASVTLAPLTEAPLNYDDSIHLGYLNARIAYVRGQQGAAQEQLLAIDRPDIHPALAYRIHNFERHLLDLGGEYLQSAELGARILVSAPEADRAAIKRALWRDLQRADNTQLQRARAQASNAEWRGWLELARISRGDLVSLAVELPRWQQDNPVHPGNNPLPGGLGYLLPTSATPDTVALILPLSGRLAAAGKAVRDGYLAHYFHARASGIAPQEVLVLDSVHYGSALAAYNDAVLQGARLVVGPLSKESVTELAMQVERPVPVLALNRIDQPVPAGSSALVQMALAPEDEAVGLAELAYGRGARRALIIRPAGAWGDKVEQAFRQRWQSLGGIVASSASYTGQDDYSPAVKNGMGLEASEQRKSRVRDMFATNVEFTPRRRQDLDAIFMLSRNGPEARSVKPLLAFHYAGSLPIYATSSIYSGTPDERDRDLDGINLVDIPWLLGGNPALKDTLAEGNTGSDHYTRLNALGVDAYRLQAHFPQLQGGPDALLRGDTGLLSMNPQLQILRELSPATFDGGELTPR